MQIYNLNGRRWINGYERKYSCNAKGQIFRHHKTKTRELKTYLKGNKVVVGLTINGEKKRIYCLQADLRDMDWSNP